MVDTSRTKSSTPPTPEQARTRTGLLGLGSHPSIPKPRLNKTNPVEPSTHKGDRTLGNTLVAIGAAAVTAGILMLVTARPVGLLVLMVGVATLVIGLDTWTLRAPVPVESAQLSAYEDSVSEGPETDDDSPVPPGLEPGKNDHDR